MPWAIRLPFTGVPARCISFRVWFPGSLRSCSLVCPRGLSCCVCGVLGHLAPVHRCAFSVCCFACACPGPLGSCSPVWPLGALFRFCGVLNHLGPVPLCARSACCVACAVSWTTLVLLARVPARRVVLRVRCPGPLGSYSPVCALGVLFCLCGVLGHLAPVHQSARLVRCLASAVSWTTWLLFTDLPARRVVLCMRCPGPLGSWSALCPLGGLCCLCGVLGHLAPVHRCVRSASCVACGVSWATWLLFTGVPARRVLLRVRCPWPLCSCSPVCPLGVMCCMCSLLGHLAPVHRCSRSVRCFACAVSWATWLLFTCLPLGVLCCVCGVLGDLAPVHRCARSVCCLCLRCPGPLGSCSPVCPLGVLFCFRGVLGHLALVHRCARLVRFFACAVSWATSLLFTSVPAWFVVLRVRCPPPLNSCLPVCPLGVLFCLCGVLGHLAPVHRCARSVPCFACAVFWATWLLFTGVPARCVVLLVRCPGPLGSCSPMCALGALPVCAVSWPTWLLFTGVPAWCVVLLVRCPGPLGSCSPVCPLGVLFCLCGVLGHSAPVHQCARSVCFVACAVSPTAWPLFTGVPSRCVVLWVGCAGRRCGALTRSSGRWLFVAGRGWVPCERALVHPDGGCS